MNIGTQPDPRSCARPRSTSFADGRRAEGRAYFDGRPEAPPTAVFAYPANEAISVPVTRTVEQVDLVRGLDVTLGVESHQDRVGFLSASDDLEAIAQLGRDVGSCVQLIHSAARAGDGHGHVADATGGPAPSEE